MSILYEQLTAPEAMGDTMQLLKRETFDVDVSQTIYEPSHIGLPDHTKNFQVGVVAELALPGETPDDEQHLAVLKLKTDDGGTHFAMVGLDVNEAGEKMLAPGASPRPIIFGSFNTFQIGRDNMKHGDQLWPGQGFSTMVSRKHLLLTSPDGESLSVTDISTYGTKIAAHQEQATEVLTFGADDGENLARHTTFAHQKAEAANLLDQEGKFAGRHKINRDTTDLEGKVDIRSWGADDEAIVVESKKHPEEYDILRGSLNVRLAALERKLGRAPRNEEIAGQIYELVTASMTYDLPYVNEVVAKMKKENPDDPYRKINLSYYLHAGRGVCRQMALATAWLGGEMVKAGRMDGAWTAEVNEHAEAGAHEWARYTAPDGEVYISDTAQNFFGTLKQSLNSQWNYFRPGERRQYMAKYNGRQLLRSSRSMSGRTAEPTVM